MRSKQFKTITRNVNAGGWVDNIPNFPSEVKLLVRPAMNRDAARLIAEERARLSAEEWKDPDYQKELDIRITVETILLNWAGLEDDETGQPIAYDPDLARQWLEDPEYEAFQQGVNWASQVVAERGKASLEDAAKN